MACKDSAKYTIWEMNFPGKKLTDHSLFIFQVLHGNFNLFSVLNGLLKSVLELTLRCSLYLQTRMLASCTIPYFLAYFSVWSWEYFFTSDDGILMQHNRNRLNGSVLTLSFRDSTNRSS